MAGSEAVILRPRLLADKIVVFATQPFKIVRLLTLKQEEGVLNRGKRETQKSDCREFET